MQYLAQSLDAFLEEHFRAALARDGNGPVRPVLVGPPDEALREMFALLTSGGTGEWRLPVAGGQREVIVLLVDGKARPAGSGLSRVCNWDYAVTMRNSQPLVLILAARRSWDTRPESLANTTETLGDLGVVGRGGANALQSHLVGAVASKLGLPEKQARELIRVVRQESVDLEPALRDAMSWEVIDNVLGATPAGSPTDVACRAAGLPVVGNSGRSFGDAHEVLCTLGKFVGLVGLRDAIDQMKNTNAAQARGVSGSLDALMAHLSARLLSPTLLEAAPSRYYRVPPPVPAWYDALTTDVLAEILAELHQSRPQDRLNLSCTNSIPGAQPLPGGPFVVAASAELRAASGSGSQPSAVNFSRKVDRATPDPLPAMQSDPLRCADPAPPGHNRPIKYKAEAPAYRAGTVEVLVLDSFRCGGLVVVRGAERNGAPAFAARAATWTQELILPRGGMTELLVFHSSRTAQVSLGRPNEAPTVLATQAGGQFVVLGEDVEDNDVFEVQLRDATGASIGKWLLQVTVRDSGEISDSRLEALIREHRTGAATTPRALDTPLHRLELGAYIQSPDSWKPVLGCWSSRVPTRLVIDWASERVVGDVEPQINPRLPITPPASVLAAREAVRSILRPEQRCLSEIEFDKPSLAPSIEAYLRSYADWLQAEPQDACWLDVFAIHSAEWNAQAGRHVATDEPVVILLSPLHPLRLAWHAVAQTLLKESLAHLCPAAGLLSPYQCPDACVLYLRDGQSARPRAFFSLPCEHPHWAVLANTAFLDRPGPRAHAMERLADLGLVVQSITGGFTSQQTQDSLQEVARLLPARATLRVGIVGDAEGSSECALGVLRWSERQNSQDRVGVTGGLQVEVFDTRGAGDPSPEQLADLSETTGERVRWYNLRPDARAPKLDLTIIDHLGARTPEAATGERRSAQTSGSLFRVRVREDFLNARAIVESRVVSTRLSGTELPELLARTMAAFEALSAKDADRTQFRFTPNQDAVGTRLQNAIFLAVTSSQIDPACIVRGTVGQGGYLWDYELPGVLGGGEAGLGYYLVAKPNEAMSRAVEKAASIVADPPPSVPGLLEEVSRRGIPILKRLAGGGSQSRGELGLLLATRLLQDAFRQGIGRARLPVWAGNCIHLVLPVDPYEELFGHLRRALLSASASAQRPDLVVAGIELREQAPAAVKLTPVEVKYRAGGMAATELREALEQAAALGALMDAVWVQPPPTELWKTCGASLLAQFLDFGFRIYAADWLHGHEHTAWAAAHQRVMQDVLERVAQITVNAAGRLVVFDGSASSRVADLDGDNRADTVVASLNDARVLLAGAGDISPEAHAAVQQLDFSFPGCSPGTSSAPLHPATTASAVPLQGGSPAAAGTQGSRSAPEAGQPGAMEATVHAASGADKPGTVVPAAAAGTAPTASTTRIPSQVRGRVREAFRGFVGNEPAVGRLSNDLLRALIDQPPHLSKNYLFTGLPSTGKTELARRMAEALALPFIKLDGRGVSSRDKLFELINGELQAHGLGSSQIGQQVGLPLLEYPPLVVFIDEVHLVPRGVQEAMLTMLEAADRTVVLSDHVARVQHATFLFATTRASDVDAAFVSRCDEIQLREYTEAQVARILRWKVRHDDWPDTVYEAVARLGRSVPRIAIQLAEALETAVLVSEREKPLLEHLEDVRHAREIDENGLTPMDFQYLDILERAGGPVGEQNILNLMRTVDKDRILNEVEPFLVRLGFVRHGPRGRDLTREGREYLLAHRARGMDRL